MQYSGFSKTVPKLLLTFLLLLMGSDTVIAQNQERQQREETEPSLGTVPGLYYDPSGELSPSLKELEGATEAGGITFEREEFDTRYNTQRVWQQGATPDEIIKVGDLENNPTLEKLINLDNLTLREIAANGGADIEQVPLKSIGIINSMTVREYFELFPELENESISNVPILLETVINGGETSNSSEYIEQIAQEKLADIDPRLSEVPVGQILNGDWDGIVENYQKRGLEELVKRYPVLQNVPIADILNGNGEQAIKERALTIAQEKLVKELADNPAFEGIPIEQLANGNWSGVLEEKSQEQIQKLLEKYPELEGLPADKLFPIANGVINGDWDSVVQQAQDYALEKGTEILAKELIKAVPALADTPLGALPIESLLVGDLDALADVAIAHVPKIANKYLSQLGHLSQTPGTMLVADTAMILLTGDIFGRLDIPFAGEVETPVIRVVTGGTKNQVFLPESCVEESCKHFEIVDVLSGIGGIGNVQGKAWIQGSSQSVPGGKGFLRWVNAGKERTGVPVWTTDAHVKLSLEDIDEGGNGEPATARIWLDFQICVYPPFMGEHCTPHAFSFPTPWKVQEGGLMLVFSRASAPDIVYEIRNQVRSENRDYRSCRTEGCQPTTEEGDGIASGTLINPAPGYRLSSGFGWRPPPCDGCSAYHPAVDLATPPNTSIRASDGGVVIYSGWVSGYGYTIVVDHGNGVKTRYSHLNQINVRNGQSVSQGQIIALSGATGNGTGPHLDFGVYVYRGRGWTIPGKAIDPQSVIDFS